MQVLRTVLLSVASTALVAGSAIAADPVVFESIPVAASAPAAPGCATSGYVDVFFGAEKGVWYPTFDPYEEVWHGLGFGGAGRAAIQCSPTFSIQLDAWADHWSGVWAEFNEGGDEVDDGDYSGIDMGIGTHLTFRSDGFLGGALLSLGADDGWGTFATLAAEAAFNTANLRVQGQVGLVKALFGNAADFEAKSIYAQVVAAFYPNPGVSISGTLGFDKYNDNDPHFGKTLNWGARAEFQIPGKPVSFYVAYRGESWRGGFTADVDDFAEMEHAVSLGIRFLVGQPDVRSMDEAVGLVDYNPTYGAEFRN